MLARGSDRFQVCWPLRYVDRQCIGCHRRATFECVFKDHKSALFGLCTGCLEKHEGGTGWVYFIRAGEFVKIGYSTDVAGRFATLKTGSAVPLEVMHTQRGSQSDERELHKRFAADRAEGEWFRVSDEIRRYITLATASPDREKAS